MNNKDYNETDNYFNENVEDEIKIQNVNTFDIREELFSTNDVNKNLVT